MGIREDQRALIVDRLAAHLLATGLAEISLRQLAAAAGVSDRMLLYYFEDKGEVLGLTMQRVAAELAGNFAQTLPEGQSFKPAQLISKLARMTTAPDIRPYMRLWIEMVAMAAKKEAPFATIARDVADLFIAFGEARLTVPEGWDRRAVAAAIIALIDGLALVDVCAEEGLVTRVADLLEARADGLGSGPNKADDVTGGNLLQG